MQVVEARQPEGDRCSDLVTRLSNIPEAVDFGIENSINAVPELCSDCAYEERKREDLVEHCSIVMICNIGHKATHWGLKKTH